MTLTMDVEINARSEHLSFVRKEYETRVLPFVGLEIEDTAWKKPRKVISVVVSYQSESIYIELEPYDINDSEYLDQEKEMFKGHGWEIK